MKNSLTSVIALDVGGSSVKSGLVQSDASLLFVSHTPLNSQASKDDVLQEFAKIIQSYLLKIAPDELIGIAFGFPGPFDYEIGEDLGQFLRPFVEEFAADVLIVLGGIAGAIEYFHSIIEDQLNIPVYPGEVQGAALLGAASLYFL